MHGNLSKQDKRAEILPGYLSYKAGIENDIVKITFCVSTVSEVIREVCNTRHEVSCLTANALLCSSPLHPSCLANVSLSIAGDKGRKDCLCEAQKAPPRLRSQQ